MVLASSRLQVQYQQFNNYGFFKKICSGFFSNPIVKLLLNSIMDVA